MAVFIVLVDLIHFFELLYFVLDLQVQLTNLRLDRHSIGSYLLQLFLKLIPLCTLQ